MFAHLLNIWLNNLGNEPLGNARAFPLQRVLPDFALQVPETSFGVPYIEFTATEETLGQIASFKGCEPFHCIQY